MEDARISEVTAIIERIAARTKVISGTLECALHVPISPFDFAVRTFVALNYL